MPFITDTLLPWGPTCQVRIEVQVKNRGNVDDRKLGEPIQPPVQKITGIQAIEYNDSVGGDTKTWVELEKGLDVGQILREHAAQKREIAELKRRNRQYENRLTVLQLNQVEVESKENVENVPTSGKREVIRA